MRLSGLEAALPAEPFLGGLLCAACLARCMRAMVANCAPAECPINDICTNLQGPCHIIPRTSCMLCKTHSTSADEQQLCVKNGMKPIMASVGCIILTLSELPPQSATCS